MKADIVFVGGGLHASLAVLALREQRPELTTVVVEAAARLCGNHTWSFHTTDVPQAAWAWLQPVVAHRWPSYDVVFPSGPRTVPLGYATVTSESLATAATRAAHRVRLGRAVVDLGPHHVVLDDGSRIDADLVIDARGPESGRWNRTAWQSFVGLELETAADHPWTRPLVMDARVSQAGGLRFMYVLPFTSRRVLIEDTAFSTEPLDPSALRSGALAYAASNGVRIARTVREEAGALPLPLEVVAGEPAAPQASPLRAGYAGGWFHPTTGYSIPAALRFALALAVGAPRDLAPIVRAAKAHSAQTAFFRRLNRLWFDAIAPTERWRVLERFHRHSAAAIGRFYAAELTTADRLAFFVGRPPAGLSWRRAARALGAAA